MLQKTGYQCCIHLEGSNGLLDSDRDDSHGDSSLSTMVNVYTRPFYNILYNNIDAVGHLQETGIQHKPYHMALMGPIHQYHAEISDQRDRNDRSPTETHSSFLLKAIKVPMEVKLKKTSAGLE